MDPVLTCDGLPVHVGVGVERRLGLQVHNTSDAPDHYRFEVLGEPGRWSRVEPRHLPEVVAGARAEVELVLHPPPGASAGVLRIGVRCESMSDPARCAVVEGDITIGATQDLEVTAVAVAPRGRHAGHYIVEVRNQGSTPTIVRLSGTDARQELGFAVSPQELSVAAGQSDRAYLSARPRRPRLVGRTVTHSFAVEHRPASGPKGRLPMHFEQRPVLGRTATAGALLLTVALTMVAALLLLPTVRGAFSHGRPAATTAAQPSAAQKDPVHGAYVVWSVTPAGDVVNKDAPQELLARLLAAGVPARIVDSRTSARLAEQKGKGLLVVLQDGFPDFATADAACKAHRADLAPNCLALPPA